MEKHLTKHTFTHNTNQRNIIHIKTQLQQIQKKKTQSNKMNTLPSGMRTLKVPFPNEQYLCYNIHIKD